MPVLLGILAYLLVSCSDGSNTKKTNYRTSSVYLSANSFNTVNEYDLLKNQQNKSKDGVVKKCNEAFCATLTVSPAPATHELGQKYQQWVNNNTIGLIDIDFKKNVKNFRLKDLTQKLNSQGRPVGVVSNIYTPTSDDYDVYSCFDKDYNKDDYCTIAFSYQGLNFTEEQQKDALNFIFAANGTDDLVLTSSIYNGKPSNDQSTAILTYNSVVDSTRILYTPMRSYYNGGVITTNSLVSLKFQNSGDGDLYPNESGYLADIALGRSNPSSNLVDLHYYHNRYDNSFNCQTHAGGTVSPIAQCDMYGVINLESDEIHPNFATLVLKYVAAPGKYANIIYTSMIHLLISPGDFIPNDYTITAKESDLVVSVSNVPGNNIAFSPIINDPHFYIVTNLGIFVPYVFTESKNYIHYGINENYKELGYTKEHNLVSLDTSSTSYKLNTNNLFSSSIDRDLGGLLLVKYKNSDGIMVSQIIGSIINNDAPLIDDYVDIKTKQDIFTDAFIQLFNDENKYCQRGLYSFSQDSIKAYDCTINGSGKEHVDITFKLPTISGVDDPQDKMGFNCHYLYTSDGKFNFDIVSGSFGAGLPQTLKLRCPVPDSGEPKDDNYYNIVEFTKQTFSKENVDALTKIAQASYNPVKHTIQATMDRHYYNGWGDIDSPNSWSSGSIWDGHHSGDEPLDQVYLDIDTCVHNNFSYFIGKWANSRDTPDHNPIDIPSSLICITNHDNVAQ